MGKLIARVSFFAPLRDGSELFVGAGQEVEDTHEVVAGREALFVGGGSSGDDVKPAKKRAPKKPDEGKA